MGNHLGLGHGSVADQLNMSQPEYLQRFYLVIANIPAGQVCTYGKVAEMAGYPRMARAVGRCLKQLPKDSRLPWFRVINAKGELSFPKGSDAYLRQRAHLEEEGVVFIGAKVRLKDYLWQGG